MDQHGQPSIAPIRDMVASIRWGTRRFNDAIERHLEAIAVGNTRLNAIVAQRPDAARVEAASMPSPSKHGPLAGIPFTVKDIIATSQLPTTCGSKVMAGHMAPGDSTAVARLRLAGAVLVGKTNCPEFAFSVDTSNDLFGRTLNPLGDFSPGGSSGGEAAAIAAGFSAFGLGSDFGGSIRWPAQCTGIVGLRPTVGRVPATGLLPTTGPAFSVNQTTLQGHVQTIGPMARTVDDVERVFRAIAGPDRIDPLTVNAPLILSSRVEMACVRVRYGYGVLGQDREDGIADAVDFAVAALAESGAQVRPGLPSELDDAVELYGKLRAADPLEEIVRVSRGREDELMPFTRQLLQHAPAGEPATEALWAEREALQEAMSNSMSGNQVLVMPIANRLPLISAEAARLVESGAPQFEIMAPSRAVAFFGLPALSVPCPPTQDGRPVSVQIVGPAFREDLVLAAGRQVEQATRLRAREATTASAHS